jgi:hypothetical protein
LSLLGGIASLVAAVSFVIKKEMPRTLGLMALAAFLFVTGLNDVLAWLGVGFAQFLVPVAGILGMIAGIAFLFQRNISRNTGFLWLAGSLISLSLAFGSINWDETVFQAFLFIGAICSLPAVWLFLRRK